MDFVDKIIPFLFDSLLLTVEITLQLFGGLFVAGLLLYLLARFTRNLFAQTFGYRSEIFVTAWIGTPVHELGHAFFCLLFGHKIIKIKLFSPNAKDGSLGSVEHSYNPRNIYQRIGNFFIGAGPLIFGSTIIFLLIWFLLPNGDAIINMQDFGTTSISLDQHGILQFFKNSWAETIAIIPLIFSGVNIGLWQFWLFIYLSLAISAHIELSPPDVKLMWSGFFIILLLILIFNLIYLGFFSNSNNILFKGTVLFSYLNQILFIGLLFSFINFLITWLIAIVVGVIFLRKVPNPFIR